MADITAAMVKELRDVTNVGMMECKRALQETGGDKEQAIKRLREQGAAVAGKKAARAAKDGQVAALVTDDGRRAAMIEVNSETDFVARNASFQAFVADLAQRALECRAGALAEAVQAEVTSKIQEIGENLVVRRNQLFELGGTGCLGSYVHLGGKVAVLVEVGCEKEATVGAEPFREAVKNLTLHIAACNPDYLAPSEIPAETLAAEKAIYAKQVGDNKPPQVLDKILEGKLRKFASQICLLEQPYVREPSMSVSQWLAATGKSLDDTLTVRRFARYQLGEDH